MTGRFAGLKNLQQPDTLAEQSSEGRLSQPEPSGNPVPTSAAQDFAEATRPWEAAGTPLEPVKALNGRVPRSVRLAFDRQLTDAMEALGTDVTVDLAVEALARLVTEEPEVRERWLHQLWTLKNRPR
ncbi:hypothetical protein [Deinococcus sp.]|uniref:hypothetical protein n=1 Tax=Deinococcus sp. TaxID=47478 RepID=UPI0025E14FEC|nr:hypothetical protein [Deinococcus sp.]